MTSARAGSGGLGVLAAGLAREIGGSALDRRLAGLVSIDAKSSPTDLVTEVDRWAETALVERILAARPHDGIVGEEGTTITGTSGVDWYLDPIDGTTNFVFGIPEWCVSIGVAEGPDLVAAAVAVPALGEVYAASLGGGATCNDRPVRARDVPGLAQALVATGFGYHPERRRQQAAVLARLLPVVRDIRRSGSAAYDLCSVASGRVDGYYEIGINAWDVAGGELIATEAGAVVTGLVHPTARQGSVLAATAVLYDDLRRAIDAASDETKATSTWEPGS